MPQQSNHATEGYQYLNLKSADKTARSVASSLEEKSTKKTARKEVMISHRNNVEWRYSDQLARREAISERNDLETARSGTTSNRAMISLNTVTNILDSVQSIVIEALTGPHKQTTYCLNTITSIIIRRNVFFLSIGQGPTA